LGADFCSRRNKKRQKIYQRRLKKVNVQKHLLLCATPTKQKCFKGDEGNKTWECLKKTLKNYENDSSSRNIQILRSKVDCLRICKNGPILLIWPDGIWYEKVSPEKVSEIFTSHVINGNPIEKWIFKKTPFEK
jgi:(2Fe-2S) ferredoxin